MAVNLTFQEKLVEQFPLSGVLSGGKPAGREGYDVVVMEHIGTGWRYYCTLSPGDTLRLSERLFGKYSAYVVDMRPARSLHIGGEFPTNNVLNKVKIRGTILYRVVNSRQVAVDVEDPLIKFRDYVVSVLRREISVSPYQKVTESNCEQWILRIGHLQHLGLAVEGVGSLTINYDEGLIQSLKQRAELEHKRGLGSEMTEQRYREELREQEHELEKERRTIDARIVFGRKQTEADVENKRIAIENLNLADMNTLMHVHPELVEAIFTRLSERDRQEFEVRVLSDQQIRQRMLEVLDNYIKENPEASPEDMMRLIRDIMPPSTDRPRITFGSSQESPNPRIVFGSSSDDTAATKSLPPASPPPPESNPGTGSTAPDDDDL